MIATTSDVIVCMRMGPGSGVPWANGMGRGTFERAQSERNPILIGHVRACPDREPGLAAGAIRRHVRGVERVADPFSENHYRQNNTVTHLT